MSVKIIVDPGSSHLGDVELAKELIKEAKGCGAQKVKFQLFENLPPNLVLPPEVFANAVEFGKEIGIEVFASVWDLKAVAILESLKCNSIKFAFSQNKSELIDLAHSRFENIYVSSNKRYDIVKGAINLYCVPSYPVENIVSFESIFKYWDGFSDHTRGIRQAITAVRDGAKVIEKHFMLEYDKRNPDSEFSIDPDQLREMVKQIREIE